MSGTGSTSFPYSKGSILPDTPTTATQTHPLSGSNVIGGKKSKRNKRKARRSRKTKKSWLFF